VKFSFFLAVLAFSAAGPALSQVAAPDQQAPVLGQPQMREILDKTQTIRLAPDISHLSEGERLAVRNLIEVGRTFQNIYEDQRHRAALAIRSRLQAGSPEATLYRLFNGPIATTLDNERVPFVPVDEAPPGKTVYPWDLGREEFEAFLTANPDRRDELTHLRSVVRRADAESLARDIATLDRYPVIDHLHPDLKPRLRQLAARPDRSQLYAVPYSVAYADQMFRAYGLLNRAADAVERDDWEFAKFLRNRARDLLSDDYESGDAAWITGRFKNLNAEIGAYETYDDELTGTRAFYALNVLARRANETETLRRRRKCPS
jgi:hypothetical protein